jgi:hypothetical protein
MRPKTRDNLIYLGVALSIAAFVTADAFYADSRGKEMWMPSKLAFRLVCTTGLLGYFVARETRKVRATLFQVLACVLVASLVHLIITIGFRQTVGQLAGIPFSVLVAFEIFFIVQLAVKAAQYLRSNSHRA